MFTRVWIDRKSNNTQFLKDVKYECNRLKALGSSQLPFGDMSVSYGSYGICCQFGKRLMKLPTEFDGLTITHVTFDVPYWHYELIEGDYKRKRAWATVSRETYDNKSKPDYWRFNVEGETLAAATRLYEDIIAKRATPRIPPPSQFVDAVN